MKRRILSRALLVCCALAAPASATAQAEQAPTSSSETETKPATPSGGDAEPDPAWQAARPATAPSSQPSPAAVPNRRTSAPPTEEMQNAFVVLPYIGLQVPVGAWADGYGTGLRIGAIVGRHLTSKLSVDGEVTLDLMDADADSSVLKPHEYYLDFALAPLVHLRSGQIVFGPKLGWFVNNRSKSAVAAQASGDGWPSTLAAHSGRGFVVGANLAGLTRVGGFQVGLLANGTFRHFVAAECGPGGVDPCGAFDNVVVLSVSLTALF